MIVRPVMHLRPVSKKDIPTLHDIWSTQHGDSFSLPSPAETYGNLVTETDSGKVVAYGAVKPLAEVIMLLDQTATPREKALALRGLMIEAIRVSTTLGFKDLHAFIEKPDFSRLLEKHYGFKKCLGEALILEV
jgi:hypothetical protein